MWGLLTGASDKAGHPVLCPPHQPPEARLRGGNWVPQVGGWISPVAGFPNRLVAADRWVRGRVECDFRGGGALLRLPAAWVQEERFHHARPGPLH